MRRHADAAVVPLGLGRREQNEIGVKARRFVRAPDKLAADAAPLVRRIDGEIRQVHTIGEVADRARHADQQTAVAGGDDDVSVPEHAGNHVWFVDGPALGERRPDQQVDELAGGKIGLEGVLNQSWFLFLIPYCFAGPYSTRPGRAAVIFPFSNATCPLTITVETPTA